MAKRTGLKPSVIERLTCPAGKRQHIVWDDSAPGLGVRVTAGGTKSYVFETRVRGRTMRTTIGSTKTWLLSKAQKKARQLKASTDQGIDPRQIERERIAAEEAARDAEEAARAEAEAEAKRNALLVSEAWGAYVEHHARRWGPRHKADHTNLAQAGGKPRKRGTGTTVAGVLHPLLQMRMADITAPVLIEWQAQEAKKRANNARQGFELFRAFWRWCRRHKVYRHIIDADALESTDLAAEVPSCGVSTGCLPRD